MQIAPDLVIGQMDFPGAEEIAQRFKKMLPPQLQDDAKGDPQAQLAQAASAVQTLQQQLQALNAHAQQVEGELQQLQGKSQTEQMRFQLDQQKLQLDAAKIELDHERFELDKQLAIAKQNLEQQISIAEIDLKQQKLNLEAEVSGKRIALDAIKHDDSTSLAYHENVLKGIQVLYASMPDESSSTEVKS
jgi:predicted RNase H-like nuclease (RuvC/YqgF family)